MYEEVPLEPQTAIQENGNLDEHADELDDNSSSGSFGLGSEAERAFDPTDLGPAPAARSPSEKSQVTTSEKKGSGDKCSTRHGQSPTQDCNSSSAGLVLELNPTETTQLASGGIEPQTDLPTSSFLMSGEFLRSSCPKARKVQECVWLLTKSLEDWEETVSTVVDLFRVFEHEPINAEFVREVMQKPLQQRAAK